MTVGPAGLQVPALQPPLRGRGVFAGSDPGTKVWTKSSQGQKE